jgi:murein L,D-transpeptidase YafK
MRNWLITVCFFLSLSAAGCKAPPIPPEAKEAETQENNLWRAGAEVYAFQDYHEYKESYRLAKNKLNQEKKKLVWFRKYKSVQLALRHVLDEGVKLQEKVEKERETKSDRIKSQLTSFKSKIESVKKLSLMMTESYATRSALMRAELAACEVDLLHQKGDLNAAEKKLECIPVYIKDAEDAVRSSLGRYLNESVTKTWKKWVEETISESRKNGHVAVIVNKLDRRLTVYKKGKPIAVYTIGLSRNGLSDKLYAGDNATPEGKYQITKKLPKSKYYKALLIDYPNQEDIEKFSLAKKSGHIPAGVGIGSLIEIHGGGNDSLTDGCISLENEDMDKIFDLVDPGTPVTIVGALGNPNELTLMRKGL